MAVYTEESGVSFGGFKCYMAVYVKDAVGL